MSPFGTFETCRRPLKRSAYGGKTGSDRTRVETTLLTHNGVVPETDWLTETLLRKPHNAKACKAAEADLKVKRDTSSRACLRIPSAANRFRLADRCDVSQAVGFRNEVIVHHGSATLGKHEKLGVGFDYSQGRAAAAHRV